jgi:hypothetical protein
MKPRWDFFTFLGATLTMAAQGVPPTTPAVTWEPAPRSLAEKAPGAPPYGLVVTAPEGKFLLTGLAYHPLTRKPVGRVYRLVGPAAWGPYRSGLEDRLRGFQPLPKPREKDFDTSLREFRTHFFFSSPEKGSPADLAGLQQDEQEGWRILQVDGSAFGGDPQTLIYHLTQQPEAQVKARGFIGFWGSSEKVVTLHNRKLDVPPAPDDAHPVPVQQGRNQLAWMQSPALWKALLQVRSQCQPLAPVAVDLGGQRRWVVLDPGLPRENPTPDTTINLLRERRASLRGGAPEPAPEPSIPSRLLEIWKELPGDGTPETGLVDLWQERPQGFQAGRLLQLEGAWYRLAAFKSGSTADQMAEVRFEPWKPDIQELLEGRRVSKTLDATAGSAQREDLEQKANDALIEWKTRTLPGLLTTQGLGPTEDLVVRLEKGLLALDLEVKGIRTKLDAAARAEAERNAQAELSARGGGVRPVSAPTQPTDTERMADLLDQRKAILMAILGSAKQTLANLRR